MAVLFSKKNTAQRKNERIVREKSEEFVDESSRENEAYDDYNDRGHGHDRLLATNRAVLFDPLTGQTNSIGVAVSQT